jgi:hypothetical protein
MPDRAARTQAGWHSGQVSPVEPSTSSIAASDSDGALVSMRIGSVCHPAVLLAFADGAGLEQDVDRPALQGPDRGPPLGRIPAARPPFRLLTQGRDSELPPLRLFPRVPPPCAQAGSPSKAAKVRRIIERVAKSRDLQAECDRRFFNGFSESTVKNSQVFDLESGNGALGPLSLPGIGCAGGDSLQI